MKKSFLVIIVVLISFSVFSQNGRSTKRGIAYGYHSAADMAAISKGACWWYNWSHQPESGVASVYQDYDMDFVPMTWNNRYDSTSLVKYYQSHPDAKYLLAFNEPNFTGQANMKPSQVAAAWPRLEAIAADYNLKIVGPAVNWCGTCVSEGGITFTDPYAYLDAFFAACPDCQVDYIAVHNYMCYTGALSSYIDGFKKYGKKIWLTEYACWDQSNITLTMQKNLMKGSIDYLENDTMVFRYSWFTGNRSGAYPYLDIYAPKSGFLTELGQFYVDYKAYIPDTSYYAPVPDRLEAEQFTTMLGVSTEAVTDFDGIDDVGYIDAEDWMEYNIDVSDSSSYRVYFRISSNAATSIILKVDGVNTDTLAVPSSGGWQNWKTLGMQTDLPKGKHKLRVYTKVGKFNLNWLRISDHQNTAPIANAGADQIVTVPESSASLVSMSDDADNDNLQYKWTKVSGPGTTVITSPTSPTTDVTGLIKGKYTFKLTVSDGTEIASDNMIMDVVYATGLDKTTADGRSVYPNPVENILYVDNSGYAGKTDLFLTDQAGRQMLSKTFQGPSDKLEIDLSGFKNGYYILKVKRDSNTSIHSIIKY